MIPSATQVGAVAGAIALTLTAAAPYASATVRRGDICPQVADVQTALSRAGFNPGGVDSVFGSRTQDAVTRFQRSRGLAPDGEVGLTTASQLGLANPGDNSSVYAPGNSCRGSGSGGGSNVTVSTNGSPLNARSGPGTNYPVVRTIPNGTVVATNGVSSGGWIQLVDRSWIARSWTTAGSGGSGGNPGNPGPGVDRVVVATNGSPLNARSGPGLNYPIIASYPNGTVLTATDGNANGWIQLTNGLWVSSSWVSSSGGGGGGSSGIVRTNGSGLNARFGPGLNYGIGAGYADGARLSLTGRSSGIWLELTNGLWVDGTWVS